MSDDRSERDRDSNGRARNARRRDQLGRPLDRRTSATQADDAPLPPAEALASAQALLDAGRPFAAHEVFEAVWKAADEPERELWRGLAQIAVGITHALRLNENGARSLLCRGAEALAPFEGSGLHQVDVAGLIDWARAATADLSLAGRPPRLVTSGGKGA